MTRLVCVTFPTARIQQFYTCMFFKQAFNFFFENFLRSSANQPIFGSIKRLNACQRKSTPYMHSNFRCIRPPTMMVPPYHTCNVLLFVSKGKVMRSWPTVKRKCWLQYRQNVLCVLHILNYDNPSPLEARDLSFNCTHPKLDCDKILFN